MSYMINYNDTAVSVSWAFLLSRHWTSFCDREKDDQNAFPTLKDLMANRGSSHDVTFSTL